jgi:hypothetical protein
VNHRGFTLVEAIVYGSIATWIGMAVVNYMKAPVQLNKMMVKTTHEQTGYRTTQIPVDDFKCALGGSIPWPSIDPSQPNPPYDPAVNSQFISWFQISDPSVSPPVSYVCYRYRDSDGALLREFIRGQGPVDSSPLECAPEPGDNAEQSVIAKGLLPPTGAEPLFSKDPAASNMIVLTLRFPGTGSTPVTIVRRIYIRS